VCITIITSPSKPRNNTNFLQSKPDTSNLVSIRQEDLGRRRRRSSEGRRLYLPHPPTQDHQSLLNPFPSNNNNKNKSFDETKACYNSSIFNQKLHHPKTALSSSNSKNQESNNNNNNNNNNKHHLQQKPNHPN
jgi:hypothetical protein